MRIIKQYIAVICNYIAFCLAIGDSNANNWTLFEQLLFLVFTIWVLFDKESNE